MKRTGGSELSSTGCQQAINSIAVTAGGLYVATHSVTATILGTTASTGVIAWRLWLTHRRVLARRLQTQLVSGGRQADSMTWFSTMVSQAEASRLTSTRMASVSRPFRRTPFLSCCCDDPGGVDASRRHRWTDPLQHQPAQHRDSPSHHPS
jgi:hypothetical protein